jgi:DNA-binding HxlR family transcriptional regulator
MRWDALHKETCSVARAISVIGDRWTLLILRDCFLRVRRFEAFQERLGITRHILADRLRKLVKAAVLERIEYQSNPRRFEYRLTQKGLDLHPLLMSLVHWGDVHMAGRKGRPILHRHTKCDHDFDPVLACSKCGDEVSAKDVRVRPGPGAPADILPKEITS